MILDGCSVATIGEGGTSVCVVLVLGDKLTLVLVGVGSILAVLTGIGLHAATSPHRIRYTKIDFISRVLSFWSSLSR